MSSEAIFCAKSFFATDALVGRQLQQSCDSVQLYVFQAGVFTITAVVLLDLQSPALMSATEAANTESVLKAA